MTADAVVELPSAVAQALAGVAADRGFARPRFHAELGSSIGDGFTSVVYRVVITDEEASSGAKALSTICKTTVTGTATSFIALIFLSEDWMYKKALPAMQELAHFKEPLPWPRCLFSSAGEETAPVLMLEDLQPEGFRMADRSKALDVQHCRLALRQIARFHGAGMALKLKQPELFKTTADVLIKTFGDDQMQENFAQFFDMIADSQEIIKDRFSDEVLAKLKVIFGSFAREYFQQAINVKDAPANALIHGDCHINNLMFQYDKSGAVTGCKLIDFQTVRFGCTALDVCSLLLPCTERAMRAEHWDSLLRGYHDELQATLRAAGIADPDAVYSWDQFMATIRYEYKLSLCFSPVLLYALCADKATQQELRDTIQDMDKLSEKYKANGDANGNGESAAPPAFKIKETPELKRRFGDLVQDLVDWGWL